ncbi:MAG: Bsu YqfO NIF3/CutA domain protein, partial [Phycisphaerales bacterium]|nr:Bsu YqfO NIF3/CutA domain protein [Phycisphaerales bacterium]
MKLADVVQKLDAIAPPHLAESWDNVGLLVGDGASNVSRAMLCIDYAAAVAAEAKAAKCDLVIAYHPPIFNALKRFTASDGSALVFDAARSGLAIYSPHTALDVAEGGTNDVLADILGVGDRRPLRVSEPKVTECKLVTFAPADEVEAISSAMFGAGAGHIGRYSSCSFRSEGVGTYFGEAGSQPAVGQAGRLEKTGEIRIETIVPLARVSEVIAALKAAHSYETPAFDLLTLTAPPTGVGIGRVGSFAAPVARADLIARVRHSLGLAHVLVAGPLDGLAQTAAICAGAGG